MAVHYLVHPPKITKRVLTAADITLVAPVAFAAVVGTRMKFNVRKYSLIHIQVHAMVQVTAGPALVALDYAIDGVRKGQTNGLKSVGVLAAGINLDLPMGLDLWLDDLVEGEHLFELQGLASAGNLLVRAAAASSPLVVTVIEHAAVYPPPGVD